MSDRSAAEGLGSSKSLLAMLLFVQASLLTWSAYVHSPTWDEPGYLVAGLSHLRDGRFDLYSVNPPLVRTIAAVPVAIFFEPTIDWSLYSENPADRSEVAIGRAMIEDNGPQSRWMFFVARLAVLPIALIGTLLCWLIASQLCKSTTAGLIAAALWAFSPDSLAFGSVITPDLATAVSGLAAGWLFWGFYIKPTAGSAALLAAATAIAMLCKSIWLILPAIYLLAFVALIFANWIYQRRSVRHSDRSEHAISVETDSASVGQSRVAAKRVLLGVAACAVAFLLVNAFYGFNGSFVRLKDFAFRSELLTGNSYAAQLARNPSGLTSSAVSEAITLSESSVVKNAERSEPCLDCPPATDGVTESKAVASQFGPEHNKLSGNRFESSLLGFVPVPLPARYVQGIDIQRLDFEFGNYVSQWQSYFAGQWQQGGWWYFYLVGIVLKTPLPFLLLLLTTAILLLTTKRSGWNVEMFVCVAAPAISALLLVSWSTEVSRYLRYALPMLPVLAIFGGSVAIFFASQNAWQAKAAKGMTAVFLLGFTISSMWNGPHWLSYFNALAGGPSRGHEWFADCNVDWGQDLHFVEAWLEQHPDAKEDLHLAYFGAYSPVALGIEFKVPPFSPPVGSTPSAFALRSYGPMPGWYIISKNYVIGHPMPVPGGDGKLVLHHDSSLEYFKQFKPIDEIGNSMLVYHLQPAEVNRVRLTMGLPVLRETYAGAGNQRKSATLATNVSNTTKSTATLYTSSSAKKVYAGSVP